MNDRDCENCVHHTGGSCSVWECSYEPIEDDLISRKAAIDTLSQYPFEKVVNCISIIEELPSAQPTQTDASNTLKALDCVERPEPHYDEWCDDCKEYDKERHCCPRWNKVILETLKDTQSEPQWVPCSERLPEENHWLGGSGKQFSYDVLISIWNSDDEDAWVDISHTIDGEWELELPKHCQIVAWRELPEPYREEGGER